LRRGAALLAAALLIPAVAAAQTAPPPLPTRDVSVEYGLQGGPASMPQVIRMSFDAASQRMRFDMPGLDGYVLADHRDQSLTAVEPVRRVLQVPMPAAAPGRLPTDGAVPRGQGRLDGVPCTIWNFDAAGASVCVTDDGVPLYGDGVDDNGNPRRFAAVRVEYGLPSATPPVLPPDRPIERRPVLRDADRSAYLPGLGFHFGRARR
jgi:hypothetical protein